MLCNQNSYNLQEYVLFAHTDVGRMEISLSSVLLISKQPLRYLLQFSPQTLSLGGVTTHLTFTFPFLTTPAQLRNFPPPEEFTEDDWKADSRLEREAANQGGAAASRAKHSPPSGHRGEGRGLKNFKFHYLYVSEIVMQI